MHIRGVILAGGLSSRMGRNKLMLKIGDKAIIDIVIENAKASKLDELVIVHGKYDIITDIKKVYNADYELGMSTSVKKGIENFQGNAVMLLLGDMPYITSEIINMLYNSFASSDKNIVVPVFKGKRGNPVVIGRKYFEELNKNTGDKGARDIIKNNIGDVTFQEVESKGIFIDVDDEESYKSINDTTRPEIYSNPQ
jgi:molybdenum cofactor cytidylyltransferase